MSVLAAIHGVTLAVLWLAAPARIDPAFAGRWQGSAEIVVNWTTQRTLDVDIVIDSSGRVTGVVGDARIVDGHMQTNRGALARWFGWRSDYIITGTLEGAIIEAEGVIRSGVRIPFNVVADRLEGGVHTTGSKAGGKESMVLSARGLVLRRVSLRATAAPIRTSA